MARKMLYSLQLNVEGTDIDKGGPDASEHVLNVEVQANNVYVIASLVRAISDELSNIAEAIEADAQRASVTLVPQP